MAYDIFSPVTTSANQVTQPTSGTVATNATDANIYSPGLIANATTVTGPLPATSAAQAQNDPLAFFRNAGLDQNFINNYIQGNTLANVKPGVNQQNIQYLLQQGVPASVIMSNFAQGRQGLQQGVNIDQQDIGRFMRYANLGQTGTQGLPTLDQLAQYQFQFNPNQYLPQIQEQAAQIYGPQRAQLDALRQLNEAKVEQTRLRTQEDFQARMKQEIEAINARGAFFSGGAVQQQFKTITDQQRALQDINLQAQASAADFLVQQGVLSASEANYIKDELYKEKTSAYGQYTDTRDFLLNLVKEAENRRQWSAEQQLAIDKFYEDIRQWNEENQGGNDKTYNFVYDINKPTDFTFGYNTGGNSGGVTNPWENNG